MGIWNSERLKGASLSLVEGKYEAVAEDSVQEYAKKVKPEMFEFNAISIGDKNGQAILIPLDESSKEVAEYIIRAIEAFEGAWGEET